MDMALKADNKNLARKEFFDSLKINNGGHNI